MLQLMPDGGVVVDLLLRWVETVLEPSQINV